MKNKKTLLIVVLIVSIFVVGGVTAYLLKRSAIETASDDGQGKSDTLDKLATIYAITADKNDPNRIYLATQGGLVSTGVDGSVTPVSSIEGQFLSFAVQPGKSKVVYAGGVDETGKGMGLMRSEDGGVTWRNAVENRTDTNIYRVLKISGSTSGSIYALTDNGLSISSDGGNLWSHLRAPDEQTFDFDVSRTQADTLYAATMKGLFISRDGGLKWEKAHESGQPATAVYATEGGKVYAFMVGVGFMKAKEPSLEWTKMSSGFGKRWFVRITGSLSDPEKIFVISDTSIVLYSKNEGKSWESFEGNNIAIPDRIKAGERIYQENCQECHGVNGAGKVFNKDVAEADMAPALDDSAHAWHHSNQNLIKTIMEGSEQEGSSMVGWKDTLSRFDVENVLAYIKSLWSFSSVACQGSRHMACMR